VLFEDVVGGRSRIVVRALLVLWVLDVVSFWWWWLTPSHQVSAERLGIDSFLLGYVTVVMPLLPVWYLKRSRRIRRDVAVPSARVAMVVTKAPSEPWSVVLETLEAMRAQQYPLPYDVWLCDEDPTVEAERWCADNGVRLSTRRGVADYQRSSWPRREKCKEGNLAYFYDHWGYKEYDLVAQLDADHVPAPTYLAEMMRPFTSPAVGYVAAPSICDTNASHSWAARGRLYKESSLHGPSQAGCNDGFAPVCIGSHYAVRTAAIRQIGGIGPELAEDFTTSFLLNASGWEGAFALDAEAHGEGPPTFAAMLVQEFQWSRSLMTATLDLLPKKWAALPWRLRMRFAMALSYYPMLAVTTILGLALVPIAAVSGQPWMKVNYLEFIGRWILLSLPLLAVTLIFRRKQALRPVDTKVLSWEVWLFALTRWPYVAWGICAAFKAKLRPSQVTFKVTPKGKHGLDRLPVRLVIPYLVVATVASGAVLLRSANRSVHGYVLLGLLQAATYLVVTLTVVVLHVRETRRYTESTWRQAVPTVAGPSVALVLVGSTFVAAAGSVFHLW
jgi:cellulose synthase/poly-beta-1,6-N-acetylglucosamine synthase-like glycosyltransferase